MSKKWFLGFGRQFYHIFMTIIPTAAKTIIITPTTAKIIPTILAILLATGGNMFDIAYKIIPITNTIIPPIKLMIFYQILIL